MHPVKYIWGIRALVYKVFLKHIGNMTYIGRPCFIEGGKNISIGKKTRIFPGIRLEAIDSGKIEIGNNCAIEQNVHITSKDNCLYIGDNTTIAANTFITNLDHSYQNINMSVIEQECICKETYIGEGCFIGYGAAIQAGTKLGKHCVVGSNSMVRGEYPDYCVLVGSPARIIKKYNPISKKWEKYVDS